MKSFSLFISYSHKDDDLRQELEKWLTNLRDDGVINEWYDGYLIAGDHLMPKIAKKMDEAEIILLLLSQNYLSSAACKKEMQYALGVSNNKRVISIILKDCTWKDTGCKDLLVLPDDGHSISSTFWESHERAWLSVYDGIKKVVVDMGQNFEIKDDFIKELQQVEFVTQNKKGTTLNDLFVFPTLTIDKEAFKKEPIDFDYFLEKKKNNILIKGREFSGKTAILKWLYINLRGKYSTIILDGNDIYKTRNFDAHLKKEFSKQMGGDFDSWMKLDNKVAIIDNFNHDISYNIFGYLEDNFAMTILTADDEEYMLYFLDESSLTDYAVLTLGQFDLAQQEELIRKWFQLSRQNTLEEINDLDIDKLEERVNNVITTQRIVPRYPFYILSILQSLETFMPSDIRITAYGHCYQALITAQLVKKNIRYEDLDTCFNYLRNLSYDIYAHTKDGNTYAKITYLEFRESYKSRFIISEALINKIENIDYPILEFNEDFMGFAHSYIFYFFLGMYLAFVEDEKIIDILCKNIHLRQNAFILIFTIHHTQNNILLDTIRLHCIYSFEKVEPAELSTTETQFMNTLIAELPESIISSNSTIKNRIEQRKRRESPKSSEPKTKEGIAESNKKVEDISQVELNRGLKIMEVLGQILKNRAGSFERRDVEEILSETINLGLRILNLFFDVARKPDFEKWLIKSLEDAENENEEARKKKFDEEMKKAFIKKTIQVFGYVVTIGMLNRIFGAVTSEKLTEIMSLLSERNPTPAYELINYLISCSQTGVDVPYIKSLLIKYNKSKNYWAEKTLSYYVQNYLNTHNINYKDRQILFSALNIKYLPNKAQ